MKTEETHNFDFISSPEVVKNYMFLEKIGVFKHIDNLNAELKNCKNPQFSERKYIQYNNKKCSLG